MQDRIPEVVVQRLPLYTRALAQLAAQGVSIISSQELGQRLRVTPAQIRKDLSYFGRFGKQGRGYDVAHLLGEMRRILGLEREWAMVLVGVGHLGQAILSYGGFAPEGFRVVAAFDANPDIIGTEVGGLIIHDVAELPQALERERMDIGIVAVPASQGQAVIDTLVSGGVRAILNYAPMNPDVPSQVKVRTIDPVLALQSMTFYLKSSQATRPQPAGPASPFPASN